MTIRTFVPDADFTRTPKTRVFCALCQRDIKGQVRFRAFLGESCLELIHPDDIGEARKANHPGAEFDAAPVGPECAKNIDPGFLLNE